MNGKAASVMKIIQDILSLILKFHTQLMAATWEQAGGTEGQMKHAKFKHMTASYMAFKEYSSFLFKGTVLTHSHRDWRLQNFHVTIQY